MAVDTYSGLDVFSGNSYEKELELCKEVGADIEQLKKLGFNTLQLAEIRKGIVDKVDVSRYMDPALSWTAMEEMRLEMFQGIDMSAYRAQDFDSQQLSEIRQGIHSGLDVSVYAKKDYFSDQMREIRLGLSKGDKVPVIFYTDPEFGSLQMREIRLGLESGIDISSYAVVSMPYMKMRAIREAAEDGLKFEKGQIDRFNANILRQLHLAFLDKVDISKYVDERFDDEQLEQVRISIKENLPIEQFISGDMRGDAIKEIRLGLEEGIDVSQYADAAYGWLQMKEMRLGLEHQIDITPYCKPLYQADQMQEIRLGIEEGIDISRFSTMMYTARDMRRIRLDILAGKFDIPQSSDIEATGPITSATPTGRTIMDATGAEGITEQAETDSLGVHEDEKAANSALLNSLVSDSYQYVTFEDDDRACYLALPGRNDGFKYTEEFIATLLFKLKVIKGIDKKAIRDMLKNFIPMRKYLVASGVEAIDGFDGEYEYFFDTKETKQPRILEDGTADMTDMDCIRQVKVGDKIAVYHRATKGTDGYDVHGNITHGRNGKEIPILKGNGFMILNDRVTYVASYNGNITMHDGEIDIQKLMVMREVRITDRTIKYDGTVYVIEDVFSGSEIEATGDVVVGGHVESSSIKSGGNVVVKKGITCPIRGGIEAVGDVSAKYIEGARITGRNITASYFINCTLNARGLVKTYGRSGMLYGGVTNSLYGIEVASVGNKSGIKTVINIGVSGDVLSQYSAIQKSISREEEEYNTLNTEKERLKEIGGGDRRLMQWKIKINAAVTSKEISIKELKEKKAALETEIQKGNDAQAVITEMAYQGVIFVFAGVIYKVEEDRKTYDMMIFRADASRENIVVI